LHSDTPYLRINTRRIAEEANFSASNPEISGNRAAKQSPSVESYSADSDWGISAERISIGRSSKRIEKDFGNGATNVACPEKQ